jgi:hypothetical protein
MPKINFTFLCISIAIFRISIDALDCGLQQADIRFPLYENTKIISDYRLNQAIDLGLDWCSLGIVSGAVLAGILYPVFDGQHRYDEFVTPISMIASGIFGGSIGLISGSISGIIKGRRYNAQKAQNSEFHLRKDWIGYEVWMVNTAFIKTNDWSSYVRSNSPGGCITFRLNHYSLNFLDEIRVGFIGDITWRNTEYDSLSKTKELNAFELRWSADFLKHYPLCKGYIVPYTGFSSGGVKLYFNYHLENQREKNGNAFVPFTDIITGIEFNAFDFFFIRTELSYEIFGPYNKLNKYASISPSKNLRFSLRSGCLLF